MLKEVSLRLVVLGLVTSAAGCREPASIMPDKSAGEANPALIGVPDDYVVTPAGWYHRSCVHEIEDGAVVDINRLVRRRDGTSYQIPDCLYPVLSTRPGRNGHSPVNNGWIEYGYTNQPAGNWYRELAATWGVPPVPVASYSGTQVYFTFPGLQSSAFIIQPVIQYGRSSAGGGGFWTMASWHCNGSCLHSTLTTIAAGDEMAGNVVASDCANGDCTWTITTRDVTTGQRSVLAVADTENYFWATGGAVEVYNVNFCSQYSTGRRNRVRWTDRELFHV